MKVSLIGIDLAKNIFQVCGVNQAGKAQVNRAVRRKDLSRFIAQYPDAEIAMEACAGSNHWGRTFMDAGHAVKLIPPNHVKPFVKGNKTDRNDAFAITEAARRPHLQTLLPRSLEQTDMAMLHRIRDRRISARNALSNQLRGLLSEYGIVLPVGYSALRQGLNDVLEEAENALTLMARQLIADVQAEWQRLDDDIRRLDRQLSSHVAQHQDAQRLLSIKGIGEKTASAIVAYAGKGEAYRNGRHFAANLGLVPKEHSSGGKQQLGGITKRGNAPLRRMLVQGAWSVLRHAEQNTDRLSRWACSVCERRGKHKAVVAIANKLARIAWSVLYHQSTYQPE